MKYALQYGSGNKTFSLPEHVHVDVLEEQELATITDMKQGILFALNNPIDGTMLAECPVPASVAIAVSVETSIASLEKVLSVLLEHIFAVWSGLEKSHVTIIMGGGLVEVPEVEAVHCLLPDVFKGCTVLAHDARQGSFICFGTTSRGTPVELNSAFGTAEYKIVVGEIEPHQLAGFSGGAIEAVIACASAQMIQHNYSLMVDDEAQVGIIETNPIRLDLNEAGDLAGLDLAVNVVLNPSKEAVAVLAGKPASVVTEGSKISAAMYGIECTELYDIVVASCGDVAKDTCLYRAQKGLRLSSHCCKKGGKIMFLAQCPEGVGEAVYEQYVQNFATPYEQMEEFKRNGFRMGAHKAYLFSSTLVSYDVAFVSDMEGAVLKQCHLQPVDLQEKLDAWLAEYAAKGIANPRIALIPHANTTYFYHKH